MVQAIAIAKEVNRPVKLIWTREEDTRHDKFRPHAVSRFKAGVGANGMPTAWSMRVVTSSILESAGMTFPANKVEPMAVAGLANNGYNVPNTRVEAVHQEHASAGVVLARARREPARFRDRELPRRDRDGERAGSLSAPAQAARGQARLAQGARHRGRERRLGQAAAEGPRPRHRHLRGRRQPLRAGRGGHRLAQGRGQGRSRHASRSIRATWSIRSPSPSRWKAPSSSV